MPMLRLVSALLILGFASGAHAYVGPGLGLGALGALVGALLAVLLAVVGVVWYPLKRLLKRRKAATAGDGGESL